MRPLRAYLLLRLPSGDVDVSTHRDLESVESTWRERLYPDASAAIHVGYWRPDTEDFVETIREHPGRVLVSASAVYALPPSYRSSSAPIGSAGDLPLHLALTGWGYEINDSSASDITTSIVSTPSVRATPDTPVKIPDIQCEWITMLSQESPEMFQKALDEGVFDEDSYLAKEKSLPLSLRDNLGKARFRWYCPTRPTAENIIDQIAFTPLWFQSLPIHVLDLSTRPTNVLLAKSIRVIGDFRHYEAQKVFAFENMGRKSFKEIGDGLLSVLSSGITSPKIRTYLSDVGPQIGEIDDPWKGLPPPASSTAGESPGGTSTTFTDALDEAFGLLSEKDRNLMKMRMGVGGEPKTLTEIGAANGLTRERIRQIESRCIRTIHSLPFWNGTLGPAIRRMLEEREDYLAPHGLEVMDPALKGAAKSIGVLEYVLKRFVDPELHLVKEGALCFVTDITQQEWLDAVREARTLLQALTEKRTSIAEARTMVDGLLVGKGRELREELWNAASKYAHSANGNLVAYGLGADHVVLAVLESSERPMHYSEILRMTEKMGYDYEPRRIRFAAAEVGLLYGRGTYGTMRHFPLNEAETRLVVSEAEDLIESEDATRQWHAREITERLEERGIDCGGNLNHYVVSIALSRSKRLTYLRRMIWASKSSGATGAANRLDVFQAVVSILIENGRPMPSNEIKDRLAAERGLNCFFQIQPEGRLVRVGSGVWGLVDRDVPFSEEESRRILDALHSTLLAKCKGIHSSELIDELEGVEPIVRRVKDPILLLGLAQKLQGFSVSRGQYLYLSEWGESRRMNTNDAISQVLNTAGRSGVTIQEGMERVSELLERPFPPQTPFGQLAYHLGAVYDEATKIWRLPEDEPLTEQEEVET
ncbi:sigma factor-like helix-turn-helix DNA-binding protein [Nitrogeniibacter aestuarii]|uniref:sigma factor-like helix-turn-helix DNA-binding protein n=1 Tax=Nitrogeniibacter aestuarii TaxID=2815343 RepID=UPI001E454C91|nr:sigma factor-like helix-turn-helix DNA-binding protein [Nitrogeniibacter aestuarii]